MATAVAADDRWRKLWRNVRTPHGSMPRRIRGRRGRKFLSTESVAENKPPRSQDRGKGEKAG